MLFGSSYLVIFYENFNTSYSYTRIGKINNANDLDIILEITMQQLLFQNNAIIKA